MLFNVNIIFFNVSKKSINIIELNPYNGHGITKSYTSPLLSIELASILKLDGDNLLFIGGAEYSPAGYITFGHIYGASDKIYLWKTKKENN